MGTGAYHSKRSTSNKVLPQREELQKWQETLLLLSSENDENVRQTIAKEAAFPKHNDKKEDIKNIWNKYICHSLEDILNTNKEFKVSCITVRYGKILKPITHILPGNSIIKFYWEHIKYAEGIKFTIIDAMGISSSSYIIVRS